MGNQKHYQANPDAPLFDELTSIVRKTFGMAEPLRRSLRPLAKDIVAAFVYGSVAKGRDKSSSDVDLLVVSDRLAYADVYSALEPLRRELGREINPTVYSREDFTRKHRQGNSFLKRVLEQPKIWIVGDEAAIAA